MDRSSFLKSLFVLAASPKMLAEFKRQPKPVTKGGLHFKDLQFVIPDFITELREKYSRESFSAVMENMGNDRLPSTFHFLHYEK